jgi:chlorobactene glucosyltransferase
LILAAGLGLLVLANLAFAFTAFAIALRPAALVKGAKGAADLPSLSIVVPARNEERQIEACVRALLLQDHPDFEVIVVDDQSTDETPAILERLARESARLKVVRGEALPEGWVGKPWALVQGSSAARGAWLLFTDADTFHSPWSATSVQRAALGRKLDVLSILTQQDLVSLAERALMPSVFLAIFLGTGPIDDVGDPKKPDAALFNGQYILVERTAYDAIGGHASVSGEIAEDMELARRFKRDGRFRIALAGSEDIAHTRMYHSFVEIWRGFEKNFALGVRGEPLRAAAGLLGYACLSPLSPIALALLVVARQWPAFSILAASMACGVVAAICCMRRMQLPLRLGLWVPVGNAFVLAVLAASMARFASGRGVEWRGRRYGGTFGSG